MAKLKYPDGLRDDHIDKRGPLFAHANPLSLLVLGALLAAALLGLFGGGTSDTQIARGDTATLAIHTPRTVRNGIFFETRLTIAATSDLTDATLALPPALWRDMTINTSVPQSDKEEYKDGAFRFHYGPLTAGETLEVKFDGQINPPLFGGNTGRIALLDGDREVTAVPLSIRVLP